MKILYLTEDASTSGGIEKLLALKTEYFTKNFNYEVSVISQRQTNKSPFFNIRLHSLDIEHKKRTIIEHLKLIFKIFSQIREIDKREKYDIIISTGFYIDLFLPLLKVGRKCKVIREFHTAKPYTALHSQRDEPTDFFRKTCRKLYILLENLSLSFVDKLIILTQEDKKNWKETNVEVMPNFITLPEIRYSNTEAKKIIAVGRLHKQKAYDYLLEVWKNLAPKYPEWKLEIYGVGPEQEKLENSIKSYHLENSFLLMGNTKVIHEKYSEASIYVMTSRFEGMPLVLLEAMASGLPAVSFACPTGPRDIIQDAEDGFLIENFHLENFQSKLELLMKDEQLRKEMGDRARRNSTRFSKENIMNRWKALFEELCEEKHG